MPKLSRKNIPVLALLSLSFIFVNSDAQGTFSFNYNLKIGNRGQAVFELQKALNQDEKTRVAETGPGSPGNETDYFGPLTYSAVLKFQNFYEEEVLHPLNLFYATGFVGPSTRSKLNSLSLDNESQIEVLPEENLTQGSTDLLALRVSSLGVQAGHFISLHGSGFAEEDTIFVDDVESPSVKFKRADLIVFAVPIGLAPGDHKVRVKRGDLFSNEVPVRVIETGIPPEDGLVLLSLTPDSGEKGTPVVLKGKKFEGVLRIYTGYDIIENVTSPDGETLEFVINPPWPKYDPEYSDVLPLWIYVEGEASSDGPIFFYYTL